MAFWTRFWQLFMLFSTLAIATMSVSAATAAPAPTVVVTVGGLSSDFASTASNFALLDGQLIVRGYRPTMFFYGADVGAPNPAAAAAAYRRALSCQPIEKSTAELVDYVRAIRDHGQASSVILVGHSNGGVVALGVPDAAPDLVPFIRRIVTVDSPLEGINDFEYSMAPLIFPDCAAVDELYARGATPGWRESTAQYVSWALGHGIDVAAVVNPHDGVVDPGEQGVYGPAVNYTIDAQAEVSLTGNHSSILHMPAAIEQLAAIITAS